MYHLIKFNIIPVINANGLFAPFRAKTMQRNIKDLTNFYISIGADNIRHTRKTLLAHAIGVYQGLYNQGCCENVCHAGLFHSIYGTELFQRFKLPLQRRADLRALIGEYAEKLVFINCFINRASLDQQVGRTQGPYTLTNRENGEHISLEKDEFNDLVMVHLYDHLEQVARSQQWHYRRDEYHAMARRFGGSVVETYENVFARETKDA